MNTSLHTVNPTSPHKLPPRYNPTSAGSTASSVTLPEPYEEYVSGVGGGGGASGTGEASSAAGEGEARPEEERDVGDTSILGPDGLPTIHTRRVVFHTLIPETKLVMHLLRAWHNSVIRASLLNNALLRPSLSKFKTREREHTILFRQLYQQVRGMGMGMIGEPLWRPGSLRPNARTSD